MPAALLVALLITLVGLVPATAGALFGARHYHQALRQSARLARLAPAHDEAPHPGRRTSYLVSARSAPTAVGALAAPHRLLLSAPIEDQLERPIATPEGRRGHLRVYSLHHDEYVDVVPHDQHGVRNEAAFAALAHLFRCRITGHEIQVDDRLARLLTAINDLYDRPLHLISGHRMPHTIDTSPTSQHTLGTAADVRVPGVSIDELREVAKQLGARGLGLYTHKRFVHIDFRNKRHFYWSDQSDESVDGEGESGSQRASTPAPPKAPTAASVGGDASGGHASAPSTPAEPTYEG